MSNNQYLSDYVYLAETSYANFSNAWREENKSYDERAVINEITKPKKAGGLDNPESFAKLVTDNYKVVAHHKDVLVKEQA